METRQIYFKSDFQIILQSEGGWTGVPFRLVLYSDSPKRCHTAAYDGTTYTGCHLTDDGRLCVAVDNRGAQMGFGTVMCAIEFYLDNQCYEDGTCNQHIEPFAVVCHDPDTDTDYHIVLSPQGGSTLQTIGTLPAFYMRGERGEKGEKGDKGDTGAKGDKGDKGDTGAKGDKGDTGAKGNKGDTGAPGRDGRDGAPLYMSFKVDPHNMHLYASEDSNRIAINSNKHFTVKF